MEKNLENNQNTNIENNPDTKKRNHKIGIFLLVVIILGGAYFTYYKLYGYKFVSTDNAYTSGNQYDVTAQVNGSIDYVNLEDTQELQKGALVATIEDNDYKISFERAKSNLAQAVRDFYSTDTEVKNATDNYNSELKNYNTIKSDYDRNLKLYNAGILSKKDMEASENKFTNSTDVLNQALNDLKKARLQAKSENSYSQPESQAAINNYHDQLNKYNKIKNNYDKNLKLYNAGILNKEDMTVSEDKLIASTDSLNQTLNELKKVRSQSKSNNVYNHPIVQNAILDLRNSYLNLQRTKIFTPIDGKVAKKSISLGSKVKVGEDLFTVVNLNNIWIDANFKETQLKNMKIGNPVKIESDLNKKEYEGVIVGISGGSGNSFSILPPQNATGNWIKITQRIPVRIAISKESIEKNGALPLGTSMKVTVDISKISKNIPSVSSEKGFAPYSMDDDKINNLIEEIIEKNHI